MLPFIFVFGKPISLYALCIIAGLFLGTVVAFFLCSRFSVKRDDAVYAALYAALGLVAGGKLLYVLLSLRQVLQVVRLYGISVAMRGGFVAYGGILGAFLAIYVYAKQYKVLVAPLFNLFAVCVPLVQALGRIGCFCAGCCYGIPWNGGFSVNYLGVSRFPVQVVSAALDMLLFLLLLATVVFTAKRKIQLWLYMCGYGVVRFFCEFFRGDEIRGFLGPLSVSSWMSIIFFGLGFAFLWRSFRRQYE